jgi:alpha,alpha-trehalase
MKKLQIFELGPLFEEVQMKSLFPDSKTFPDCLPKKDLSQINQEYQHQRDQADFDLKKFIDSNFELPKVYSQGYQSDASKPVKDHIGDLWTVLTRQPDREVGSLIPLPFSYIVPGGRFREIYYWDSYFTMLGLQVSRRVDMIQHIVDNFSYLIDHIGYIPNGNRTYFLGRSQPPFYSLMVQILKEEKGMDILVKYLPELEKEYVFWMSGSEALNDSDKAMHRVVRMPDGSTMNRYWDEHNTPRPEAYKEDMELSHRSKTKPGDLFRHLRAAAESGWDFSGRWFKDPGSFASIHTTDIVPVDLNCLLFHLEKTISEAMLLAHNPTGAGQYAALAQKRKAAIQKYCWNEGEKFYFDFDFVQGKCKTQFTLAAAFPLFFGVAEDHQARDVAQHLSTKFLKPGGLTTTPESTGQQWDAPNGWAPLQWMAYQGLTNYGVHDLAKQIKQNWTNANLMVYKKTGKMTEKYDVWNKDAEASGGEYPNQDGFGWTNGVFLAMQR